MPRRGAGCHRVIAGIVLAGGQGLRMGGGDKGLRMLGGVPMLAHVVARVRPQVAALAINANGDAARFAGFGLKVVADTVPGQKGPLAGVLAGMRWAAAMGARDLLTVPTDTPFLPPDLAHRLAEARGEAAVACAVSGGRVHPVVALWRVADAEVLEASLRRGAGRVQGWMRGQGLAEVHFAGPDDPFANINTPEDLAAAEVRLGGGFGPLGD